MKKILITGAAGFIGSQLAARSVGKYQLVGLDDLSTGFRSNLDGIDIDLIEGSILSPGDLERAVDGCDAVVHLAARPSVPRSVADPLASHEANATGTLRVLEAARANGGPLVIVASSSSVYGANPVLPKTEDLMPMPMSPYAVSKLATEQYALAWSYSYGMPTLAFRFFNVFGPHQAAGHAYAAVIPAFVHSALNGTDLTVHGDGTQSRDFTFVGTVCEVIQTAIDDNVTSPTPVNLAFGSRISLLDVVDELQVLLGRKLDCRFVESRVGDVKHSQADNSRLRALFPGVSPIDFRSGLAETVAWMQSEIEGER